MVNHSIKNKLLQHNSNVFLKCAPHRQVTEPRGVICSKERAQSTHADDVDKKEKTI